MFVFAARYIRDYRSTVDLRYAETKELKRRVRDVIDPKRDLGHVDGKKSKYHASNTVPEHM